MLIPSLVIFALALLIVLPVPPLPPGRKWTEEFMTQDGHIEPPRPPGRMSEREWKEFRAVVFSLMIAIVSGIMALDAMGFLEPNPSP